LTPDKCWFIGVHPINNIVGARKAGMHAIYSFKGFHDWPESLLMPKYSIDKLVEVQSNTRKTQANPISKPNYLELELRY
jgi:FMN phosphatase YigB (HAD superfamily)